jgi:hypothetical protein
MSNARGNVIKLNSIVNVKAFGATGDGVTDDRAAINAAIVAANAAGGGTVVFPEGDYLVSMVVDVLSNVTLQGDGYGSRIKCPATAWTLGTTDRFGILNIRGPGSPASLRSNIRITGLRIYGTRTEGQNTTPKLIYFESCENLTIDNCFLQNSAFEGVWSGGQPELSRKIIITNNHVYQVGYPNSFTGLPAIQPNAQDVVCSDNVLEDVGTGFGPSGKNVIIANNIIKGFKIVGIGTGDGSATGNTTITGNVIEVTAEAAIAKKAIFIDSGVVDPTPQVTTVSGNAITIIGSASAELRAVSVTAANGKTVVSDNAITIFGRGIGIEVIGNISGATTDALVSANAIHVIDEDFAASFGISISANAGSTVNVISSNNSVKGMTTTYGSYAYFAATPGGTSVTALFQGDMTTGGQLKFGDENITDGRYNDIPIYYGTAFTTKSMAAHRAGSNVLNITPPLAGSNYVIASGVLDVSGFIASQNKTLSRVQVDTEGSAASDDLDTINGMINGDLLILSAANDARTVVVKDGTGNIRCAGDFSMDNTQDRIVLLREGAIWYELARSDNGA